ncbi:MAG: transcriptional repressor [Anaerotignum sp.]|nr:transcriptional repressor [Anaerotignum sp.]
MQTAKQIRPEEAERREPYTKTQKELILQKLRAEGFRVTKQRVDVLDVILENHCDSCKEIYYKASKINKKIGPATIYRTLHMLEEIGVMDRKNAYRISYAEEAPIEAAAIITLQNGMECRLSEQEWNLALMEGLRALGYLKKDERIDSVSLRNSSEI